MAEGWAWLKAKQTELAVLGSLLFGGVALVLTVAWLPAVIVDDESAMSASDQASALSDARRDLMQVWLIGGVAVTGYLTWRRVRATESQADTARAQLLETQQQLQLSRDQIANQVRATEVQLNVAQATLRSDRIGRAIDQLANDKVEVRVGAVLALESAARESASDREQVFELLATVVREADPSIDAPLVRATLTAIGRRLETGSEFQVDLSGSNLDGLNMNRIDLSGVILVQASLRGAYLVGANMEEVDVRNADLTNVTATGANFRGALVDGAMFTESVLDYSDLAGVDVSSAEFDGASMVGTDLVRAHFGNDKEILALKRTVRHDSTTLWPVPG